MRLRSKQRMPKKVGELSPKVGVAKSDNLPSEEFLKFPFTWRDILFDKAFHRVNEKKFNLENNEYLTIYVSTNYIIFKKSSPALKIFYNFITIVTIYPNRYIYSSKSVSESEVSMVVCTLPV